MSLIGSLRCNFRKSLQPAGIEHSALDAETGTENLYRYALPVCGEEDHVQ